MRLSFGDCGENGCILCLTNEPRLQQDDFVVDDDGMGYADHGLDDWDEKHRDADEESDEEHAHRRKTKTSQGISCSTTRSLILLICR